MPPVAWVPHSMTWPTTTAPASRSQSVRAHPKRHAAGPHHERRVGHPPGHHDVGPARQGLGDPEAAEVGVGAHGLAPGLGQGPARVEVGQRVARRLQAPQAVEDVVALDVGDGDVDAELGGQLAQALRQAGRVEPPGVGHHLDAAVDAGAEDVLHLPVEGAGVAERGVALGATSTR